MVVASTRARLLTAFGGVGLIPEVGLGWVLTRQLGYQKTMEPFVDGRALDAREALELRLVNEVVEHEELLERARHWCEKAGRLPPHSMQLAKPLLRQVSDLGWEQAPAMEEFAEPMCFTTQGHRDAVAQMLRRR